MSGYPQQTYSGYPQQAYSSYPQQAYNSYPQHAYCGYQQQSLDRQVYTETITVPTQQTVMVPQTTYQARMIQVPQVQQVRVSRQIMGIEAAPFFVFLERYFCYAIIRKQYMYKARKIEWPN